MRSRSLRVLAPTYFVWSVSQASLMRPKVVAPEDGAGVAEPSSPKASGESRPTPIPTLNVSTRASPMAARRMILPRPRPAAGDAVAREGPVAREVASGGSGSVVGSVGIGWVSGEGIGLGSYRRSNGLHLRGRPPSALPGRGQHDGTTWECDIGKVKVHS